MTLNLGVIVIVSLVALLIGLSKGGMGAVLGVLATPLLSQVMPVANAISLALPLLLVGDAFALWLYWNKWEWRYIRLLMPAAIAGIIAGTLLLTVLDDVTMRRVLALFTLGFVVYKVWGEKHIGTRYTPHDWHGAVAGGASGFGSALANVGGPPFTAYMLLQNLSPIVFVGTTTLFFAIMNALKLGLFAVVDAADIPGLAARNLFNLSPLVEAWWVLPIIPAGVWLGRYLVRRIDKLSFERVTLVVLVIVALVLLFVPPR
ncbi:MAG: sulfite exporter TauE/SafE family protein [Chloroflexota bacterium]|nr:sulfite exporter TauE/SafE family protein [Chloroflexota bacterium]